MADVVDIAEYRNPGNGAREILEKYFAEQGLIRSNAPDHLLAWLWAEGYKVVPLLEKQIYPRRWWDSNAKVWRDAPEA